MFHPKRREREREISWTDELVFSWPSAWRLPTVVKFAHDSTRCHEQQTDLATACTHARVQAHPDKTINDGCAKMPL